MNSVADPLIVVSGLPRSGTSLMMGALEAGGVPLLVDSHRPADEHNQAGYFEYRPVKELEQESAWLHQYGGRAVKIIYRQLYFLPPTLPAKILFMRRDVRQVAASQRAMLGQDSDLDSWSRALTRELMKVDRWLRSQPQLELYDVRHLDVLQAPEATFQGVARFLERDLDLEAMVATVRPELFRQR